MQLYTPDTHVGSTSDPFDVFERAVELQELLSVIERNERELSYLNHSLDNLRDLMDCCEHFNDPQLMNLIDEEHQLSDQLGIDLRSVETDVAMESLGSKLKDAIQWLINKIKAFLKKLAGLFETRAKNDQHDKKIKELKTLEKELDAEIKARDTAFKSIVFKHGIPLIDGVEVLTWMGDACAFVKAELRNKTLDFKTTKPRVDKLVGKWKGDRLFLKAVPIHTNLKITDSMVDAPSIKQCVVSMEGMYRKVRKICKDLISYNEDLKKRVDLTEKEIAKLDAVQDKETLLALQSDLQSSQLLIKLVKGISDMETQLTYVMHIMSNAVKTFTNEQEAKDKGKDKS